MVTDNCITIRANDMQIHQLKEIGLPLYAIISMQNKPNAFLCHPAVLDCRKLFSFLHFTLSWHHKICTDYISVISVSRHDDVRVLR